MRPLAVQIAVFLSAFPAAAVAEQPAAETVEKAETAETAGGQVAASGRLRPLYRSMDEYSALRTFSIFRGLTLGFAGQLVLGYSYDPLGEAPRSLEVQGTPVIDLLAEFGARRVRFVIGPYTAPVYMGFSHHDLATFVGVRAGVLAGGERLRVGVIGGGGFLGWEVHAHAFIMPWRDRGGHRHGLAVSAGAWLTQYPSMTIGYRFAPAALNHAGGRWEAKQRARELRP